MAEHLRRVNVKTIGGEETELEVSTTCTVIDLKKQACQHFSLDVSNSLLLLDKVVLADDRPIADLAMDSSAALQLVVPGLVEVRRRVWMVPTLGFKGGGKGQREVLEADDTVALLPDTVLADQLERLYKRTSPGVEYDEALTLFGNRAAGKLLAGDACPVSYMHHTQGRAFVVLCDAPLEQEARSVLTDPPRPVCKDCLDDLEAQTAAQVFGMLDKEVVLLVPILWRSQPQGRGLGPPGKGFGPAPPSPAGGYAKSVPKAPRKGEPPSPPPAKGKGKI